MKEIPTNLNPLVELLTAYLEHRVDYFTLQTYGGNYIDGPYVQALQEHDNVLLIEASGDEYLDPPLDVANQQKMLFLGWRLHPEKYLPNYAQFIDQSKLSARQIAEIFVNTLHFAYGVDNTYLFEIAPRLDMAMSMIKNLEIVNG